MYNFIVLGIIPGTNIQIGFYAWIILAITLFTLYYLFHKRIMDFFNQPQNELEVRTPLHANQLHYRGL